MKFIIVLFAFLALAYCKEDVDGSFKFGYGTGNGTSAAVIGDHEGGVQGKYAYTSPQGEKFEVKYVADTDGFHPEGKYLPLGPEIPGNIVRALKYIRTHPPKDV